MVSSTDFLVDNAYKTVWCSPGQDRQYRVAPTRMTKQQGAIGDIKIGMRKWNLPTTGEWYHVFMIGDLPPEIVGMETIRDKWVSARAHCISTSLFIDIYTDRGLHFPLHRTYFLYTHNGALVVAIKNTPKIANLGLVQPFVRWRSNAWFDGMGNGVGINAGIEVEGITPTTEAQFYSFQVKWRAAKLRMGYAYAFVNGRRVKDLNLTTLKLGDTIEYIRDASIREVLEIKTKDLLSFDSILDGNGKFLLPRPGLGTTIDYWDDIDIYLLNYELAQKYSGVYYGFNHDDSIRMVTHRDYSIPSPYLRGLVENNPDGWYWNQDLRLELVIRSGGWTRSLVDEAHRIKELFKLPEPQRLNAMIGQQSLPVWRAAELENSAYTALMRQQYGQINRPMVEQAYGYNAISRLIGDTPYKVEVNQQWVTLPFSLTSRSTVYEYDNSGLLINWYQHDKSLEYPIRNLNCRYIEAFAGVGDITTNTVYDEVKTTLEKGVDYRFYISDIANGVSKNNWRDVTGTTKYYTITDGVITWSTEKSKYHTAVRSSKDFLAHSLELNYRDDLLAFTVNVTEVMEGRVPVVGMMAIPPEQFDLWMNGFSLVYGIDFYVSWPEVCIVNKTFLLQGPLQNITLRARGFCNADMSMNWPKDSGFVKYGQLSHNSRFNVRDDKVCRIAVGGQLFTRDELGFTEDGSTLTVAVKNGTPYQISHPMIPMCGVTDTDTYTLRAQSEAIDKQVEDYLTLGLPEPVQPLPDPIPAWYAVFSPFTTKLIYDMLNGILLMDEFKGEYSLQDVKAKLVGYVWILKYDPALLGVDTDYVVIDPHPETGVISLNIYQFRFLARAIEVFLGNNVQINRATVIVEEGFEHYEEDHPHPHRTWSEVGQ